MEWLRKEADNANRMVLVLCLPFLLSAPPIDSTSPSTSVLWSLGLYPIVGKLWPVMTPIDSCSCPVRGSSGLWRMLAASIQVPQANAILLPLLMSSNPILPTCENLSTDSNNMPANQARVREVASQALPPLPLVPNHTKSSAIHNIGYVGEIHRWSNFLRFVETYVQGQRWSNRVIKYTHRVGDPEAESNLIGDETGLQGVFNHSAQSIGLEFADFKCLGNPYANTPDSIMMTTNGQLKVVGELKAPWVEEHKMSEEKKTMLRHLLAQPIK
ncbi:hypothetical protein N7465_006547 [Penicillium sp. CMV-2018d]|nr:hypothetical protein N7465_006547 [Penicillium sp. CMV-2018d]